MNWVRVFFFRFFVVIVLFVIAYSFHMIHMIYASQLFCMFLFVSLICIAYAINLSEFHCKKKKEEEDETKQYFFNLILIKSASVITASHHLLQENWMNGVELIQLHITWKLIDWWYDWALPWILQGGKKKWIKYPTRKLIETERKSHGNWKVLN